MCVCGGGGGDNGWVGALFFAAYLFREYYHKEWLSVFVGKRRIYKSLKRRKYKTKWGGKRAKKKKGGKKGRKRLVTNDKTNPYHA